MNSQTIIQSTKNTIPNDDHVSLLFPFFLSTHLMPLLSSTQIVAALPNREEGSFFNVS